MYGEFSMKSVFYTTEKLRGPAYNILGLQVNVTFDHRQQINGRKCSLLPPTTPFYHTEEYNNKC